MFERFTDRARKALHLADVLAKALRHEHVGTEDVLLGLMEEGSGIAANVLKNLDVQPGQVIAEVQKCVVPGTTEPADPSRRLPHSPRARQAFEAAKAKASELGHNYVGTEHVLLGILREGEGIAVQVLKNLGVNAEDVREEVLCLIGPPRRRVPADCLENFVCEAYAGAAWVPEHRTWTALARLGAWRA